MVRMEGAGSEGHCKNRDEESYIHKENLFGSYLSGTSHLLFAASYILKCSLSLVSCQSSKVRGEILGP